MSQVAESPVRQRMRIAGVAAGAVAAVLFVQDLIANVSVLLAGYAQAEYNTGMYLGYLWQGIGYGLLVLVAFAVGVGLCVWRLAPVSRELEPKTVVLRGLLAAAVGAVLVFVVNVAFGLIGPLSGTGSLLANSFPVLNWDGIAQATVMALQSGLGAFVQQAPVVLLVVLLVWIWLGRHPLQQAVSADAAEV